MISAAHVLLNSERIADEQELLVSTCLDHLAAGPDDEEALRIGVNSIWPGASLTREKIEAALTHAQRSGLVLSQGEGANGTWTLTRAGIAEIEATRSWFSDALSRLAAQIQERATQDFGGVSEEQANLWASLLLGIFTDAITQSPESYSGDVSRAAGGTVRPVGLNAPRMLDAIKELASSEETKEFLSACLLAAIDEADSFGNEIVNYVATSCVLHSIIAGRSRAAALEKLGSLAGQRMVLDTPLLVAYLGPSDTAAHLATVIRLSKDADIEVIVPEHVIEELHDVISRVEDQYIPGLQDALKSGINARVYSGSVNEQVLELFLDAAEEKRYKNWTEFASRARGIKEELAGLGVLVREHHNRDRDTVQRLVDSLTEVVMQKATGARGTKQIARDAESMELVWRARRRVSRSLGHLWSGGWVVTNDRSMGRAYKKVNSRDPEPLVLTPGQWATLVTESAPAPEIKDLIGAAASFLRQEAVLRIAVKYPPEIALSLAKSLNQEMVTETDIRVAQLTLTDLLDEAGGENQRTGESITTFVANKRSRRQAAAAEVQREAFRTERQRMSETVTTSTASLRAATEAKTTAEKEATDSRAEIARLREERDRIAEEKSAYESLSHRRATRVAMSVVAGLMGLILLILGFPAFGIGTLIGLAIFLHQSVDWVKDKTIGHGRLFLALIPEIVGVIDVVGALTR